MIRFLNLFFHFFQCCVFIVFGLVAGIIAAVIGSMSPLAMLIAGTLIALLWSAVCALVSDFGDWSKPKLAAIVYAIVGFCVAQVVPINTAIDLHQKANFERAVSLEVQAVMINRFTEIDNDSDGIITEAELGTAAYLNMNGSELLAHTHAKANFKEVGHVTDKTETQSYRCWGGDGFSTHAGCGWFTNVNYTYGISRADLQTYPARTLKKWERW